MNYKKFGLLIVLFLLLVTGCKSSSNTTTTEEEKYTISFESNGGSSVAAITKAYNESITEPTAPTKPGHVFDGWYRDSDLNQEFTFDKMPRENLTLYAKWSIAKVTITFDTNGGTEVAPITQDYNTNVTPPFNPQITGHYFGGWFSDEDLTEEYTFDKMPAENLKLYAKWIKNKYTITFNTYGGSIIESVELEYDAIVTAPAEPTRVGYTFSGWYKDRAYTEPYTFTKMPAENLNLHAKWSINKYSISFDSNGGSSVETITLDYNSPVTSPANPTRPGYIFSGWYTDLDFTEEYVFDKMPAENIVLFAKWVAEDSATFTITFNSNGGSDVEPISAEFNEPITAPEDPVKDGCLFSGWFKDVDLTIAFEFTTMPSVNLTLYAKWYCGDIQYRLKDNGTYEIIGYTGTTGKLEIPEKFNGKNVTGIADNAFENNTTVKEVTFLGANLEFKIGKYAFANSQIESFIMPVMLGDNQGVFDIDEYAFYNATKLVKFDFPWQTENYAKSVLIRTYAFAGASSLTDIKLPFRTYAISAHAFDGATSLTKVEYAFRPGNTLLNYIGDFAFANTGLKTFDIPSERGNAITLGINLFDGTDLTELYVYPATPFVFASEDALILPNDCTIYVASTSLDAYKSATAWSKYADQMDVFTPQL